MFLTHGFPVVLNSKHSWQIQTWDKADSWNGWEKREEHIFVQCEAINYTWDNLLNTQIKLNETLCCKVTSSVECQLMTD